MTLTNPVMKTYAISHRNKIDLSLSENPLGASSMTSEAIIAAIRKIYQYPIANEKELISLIAKHYSISEETILLGAGANELLEDYIKVLSIGKNIVVPAATFPESVNRMETLNGSVSYVDLDEDLNISLIHLLNAVRQDTALIHLCNPNNPTGKWINPKSILKLAKSSPVPILISEAGADFIKQTAISSQLPSNVIVVRSFSKAYGLAGLRIGYSVASPDLIALMKSKLRSYRLSSVSICAAIAAIQDQEHLNQSISYILKEKNWLMNQMKSLGFNPISAEGQIFIAEVPQKFDSANQFCEILSAYGATVVNCSIYKGLERFIRISPQKNEVNKKFIIILKKIKEKYEY